MKPDKDKPWTWTRYRAGLCDGCHAGCCTMPVEVGAQDLVRLGVASADEAQRSLKKLAKRLRQAGIISSYREGTDLFMLASRPNGDCVFLNEKTRLCSRYEDRPEVCRKFPEIGPRPGFCPATRQD